MEWHEVVVVGAGISGIGAAIRLAEAGIGDVVLLEAADDIGGTWRANTYPGCACDVPSRLYAYSFAPNPSWSRTFATQPEVLRYVRGVAEQHGLRGRIRFGTRMEDARWDATEGQWLLTTSRGEMACRFLVAAAGPWNEPNIPAIPGLESFPGPAFHSARWDHGVDLTGRRVAVVGSGASAVQFVPEIQPDVARLHLYQRTAQWVLPKPDHAIPALQRWAMGAVPGLRAGSRGLEYGAMELVGLALRHPRWVGLLQAVGSAYLRAVVRDPDLRAALTPDYTLGCKRLLFSNTYLQSLTRPNVEVHASAVTEVAGSTVRAADGSAAEVDVLVLGTGFRILDMPLADHVRDGAGRSLADHWGGSPEAYLGTLVPGFPNAFLLLGPSLGTGHTSAFAILEAQLDLVTAAITEAREADAVLEVRRPVHDEYVAAVQAALPATVYNAGHCRSYYFDRNGRNSFSWPWSTRRLVDEVGTFRRDDVDLSPVPAPVPRPVPSRRDGAVSSS